MRAAGKVLMQSAIALFFALATLLPSLANAYDILVLQSSRSVGYAEVLKSFRLASKASQRVIVLSDYAEVDAVRIVREDRPRLVMAIGDAAVAATGKILKTPVIAAMTLAVTPRANLTGVTVFAQPRHFCELLQKMKVKRAGIIHNPNKTGRYLDNVREAAGRAGIKLEVRMVETPRETIVQLASLAGKVDALWMLPDTTAVTRETTEAYFRFGQQQNVPVISFASSYLGLGAAAVVEIDVSAIGKQAGVIADKLMDGEDIGSLPFAAPAVTTVKFNVSVLDRLNLSNNLSE